MRLESLRHQLNGLVDRQNEVRSKLEEIAARDGEPVDGEGDETRGLIGEWNELGPKADALREEIRALESVLNSPPQAREVHSPTIINRQADPLKDESVIYGPASQVRGAARTAVENLPAASDEVRSALTRSLERTEDPSGRLARHMIAASRPEYRSAFEKLLSGRQWALTADESRSIEHVRAASLTDASGGYAVPTVIDPTLIITGTHDGFTPNPIRQLANVRQITGDNLSVTTSAGITASYVAEAAEATDDAPTLAQVTLTPYRAHAFVPFSVEIGEDWPAFESEMRRLLMLAKDDLELTKFTLGTGSTQPLGLVYDIYTNYSGQVQASATTDVFAKADVYATIAKVANRFRQRGSWIANELIYDKVRQFDTSGGADLWVQLAADRPGTLLGRPAFSNAQMDGTITASSDNYVLVFGDIAAAYTIVDRVGMTVELVPHLFGATNNYPTGQRGFYARWRNGARVVDSGAVGLLNVT